MHPAPRAVRLYESMIPSGNAYKVSLLLAHLEQPIEVVELDILATPSETRRPEFLAKNPNGRVPVVELADGSFLAESNAILFYLAEGTPYLSDERLERAGRVADGPDHEASIAPSRRAPRWPASPGGRPHSGERRCSFPVRSQR